MPPETPHIPEESGSTIFEGVDDVERYEYEHGIRKARNALFIAGGLMFVTDGVMLFVNKDMYTEIVFFILLGIDLLVLMIFLGLGFWTKRKPFTALVVGLIVFCAIHVFAIINDPTNIYKGIIIKVAVIATLVAGIKKAKRLQELNRVTDF